MLDWKVNVLDLLAVLGVGFTLYGRMISMETKVGALWAQYTKDKGQD